MTQSKKFLIDTPDLKSVTKWPGEMKIQQELCPVGAGRGCAWEWPTERDAERLQDTPGQADIIRSFVSGTVTEPHYITWHTHHVDTRDTGSEPGHGGPGGQWRTSSSSSSWSWPRWPGGGGGWWPARPLLRQPRGSVTSLQSSTRWSWRGWHVINDILYFPLDIQLFLAASWGSQRDIVLQNVIVWTVITVTINGKFHKCLDL